MYRQPVKTSFLRNNRLICMIVMKSWPAKIDFYENSRLCFAFALSVQPAKFQFLILLCSTNRGVSFYQKQSEGGMLVLWQHVLLIRFYRDFTRILLCVRLTDIFIWSALLFRMYRDCRCSEVRILWPGNRLEM